MNFPYDLDPNFDIGEDRLIFEAYQRMDVKPISGKWDPFAVATIAVAHVGGDVYACVDGGRRVRRARKEGVDTLPACVYVNLDYEARAALFVKMDERKKLTAFDRYTAKREANDSQVKLIDESVAAHGFRIVASAHAGEHFDADGKKWRDIGAVATMFQLANNGGRDLLNRVLQVAQCWVPPEQLPTIDLLASLGLVVSGKSEIEMRRFIGRLEKWSPQDVQREVTARALEANAPAARGSGGTRGRYTAVFRDIDRELIPPPTRNRTEMVAELTSRVVSSASVAGEAK